MKFKEGDKDRSVRRENEATTMDSERQGMMTLIYVWHLGWREMAQFGVREG
jgi:hypothetical protein